VWISTFAAAQAAQKFNTITNENDHEFAAAQAAQKRAQFSSE
jgi:hypothetical protein